MHPHSAVAQCISEVAAIEAAGIDRLALERVAACMARLAANTELFSFENFPLPTDPAVETAVHTIHVGADGALPLQVLSGRVIPGSPRRAAHLAHQHPTWAGAACVRGATFDTLWVRSGADDRLTPLPEHRVGPGTAFTMMPHDIHSVRGDPDGPSLHLLLYGRAFDRAVVFEPEHWRAYVHRVAAIAA